jgi:hypothetical protein
MLLFGSMSVDSPHVKQIPFIIIIIIFFRELVLHGWITTKALSSRREKGEGGVSPPQTPQRRERRFPPRAGGKRRRLASRPGLGPEHGPPQPAAERYLQCTRGQRIVTRLP